MLTRHAFRAVLWDLDSGLAVRDFVSPGKPIAVGFFGDGQTVFVAAGGYESRGGLRVFDVATGAVKWEVAEPTSTIRDATVSADGRYVAAACGDQSVLLWNGHTGELLHRRVDHNVYGSFVRFSPDGKRLLTGGGSPATL
jgi:WD40 repeat protein